LRLKTTYYLRTLGASNIEKATTSVKKEVRGRAGVATTDAPTAKKEYSAEEKKACSIEAMMNGEECEACQ
jgi:ribonucleoside-diphosphate reductase alpha chain